MKSFKSFDKEISWNTKFYVLLAFFMAFFAFLHGGYDDTALFTGSVLALCIVLLVDYYKIISSQYPQIWRVIKQIVIGLVILLTLLGFVI